MDLVMRTGAVKLRSHLDKYLVSDEYGGETVRQSRNGSTKRAIWIIETCLENPDAIRIKSLSSSLYLTASDSSFLLGVTGKRVLQLSIFDPDRVEWEPVSDGFLVKFRNKRGGTYLRGNGGSPPWRNSVTHDVPITSGTYNWILWDVEPVSLSDLRSMPSIPLSMSSFNSVISDGSDPSSPNSGRSIMSSPQLSFKKSGMDLFRNAKAVRLKSNHGKYLVADEDEESVTQDRNGAARNAKWTVEFVENAFRLKSCYNKYLTASNLPFLLGMTGHKVTQSVPRKLDSSVEWEPEKEGSQVRIRTRFGNYLRANGGLPPWRNSVTHDVPHRTVTKGWVLWYLDIVERSDQIYALEQPGNSDTGSGKLTGTQKSFGSESSSVSVGSDRFERQESNDFVIHKEPAAPLKVDGRLIYYHIADDLGGISDEGIEGNSFVFKGHTVSELTSKFQQETALHNFFVCTRSPLNGKLYPLRLSLPPNNAPMHIVVIPSTSLLAREFDTGGVS